MPPERVLAAGSDRALTVGGSHPTRLMGILNVTPDSFSDGGDYLAVEQAVQHGLSLVADGADVLDVGGESTRPGYQRVSDDEQLGRVLPVIEGLRKHTAVPISIDTTRAKVADQALRAGADWVNDTTSLREDPDLGGVVADHGCPLVLMHRFDPPRSSADRDTCQGPAMVERLVASLGESLERAKQSGIDANQVFLDPGVGFGTQMLDNVDMLAHVELLRELGCPLLVGPSRKSFLGELTQKPVSQRIHGTAAAVTVLALAGVEVIRVHDVAAMADVVRVADAVRTAAATNNGSMTPGEHN